MTTSEVRRAERTQPLPEGEPPQHEMALGMPYVRALARAGAVPIVLPPLRVERRAGPAALPARACACPAARTSTRRSTAPRRRPTSGRPSRRWTSSSSRWRRVADAAGLPILGICRGAQALNVARGGTLHQHLPAITDHSIAHRQTDPGLGGDALGARGGRVAGCRACSALEDLWVNSFHHQAVDELGSGLHAVAWAPDGTVEGIEDRGERFVLGVQWHAETLDRGPVHPRLFEALVAAASGVRLDLAA